MKLLAVLRITLLGLAALVLAGCMSSARQVPATWNLTFNTTPATNSGAPLKVRVFLLRSDATFMSTDFYSLQNSAGTVLGDDLLDTQQLFLTQQTSTQTLKGDPPLDARYIGVIAEYQSINGKTWRLSIPLPAPTSTNFYKFWQFSPDEMQAAVAATANGLHNKPVED